MNFGWPEILIVLVIVVLLFGVGRIGKVGSEIGQGIRNFRDAMNGDKEKPKNEEDDKKEKKEE
jgi:sec-independent protein translocase protein TatA